MTTMKRVYHPTGNAWQDVPEASAKAWKDAGWRLTKPDHVDESDAHPVGEHPGHAQIPVLTDTSPTVTTSTAATRTSAATTTTGDTSA